MKHPQYITVNVPGWALNPYPQKMISLHLNVFFRLNSGVGGYIVLHSNLFGICKHRHWTAVASRVFVFLTWGYVFQDGYHQLPCSTGRIPLH